MKKEKISSSTPVDVEEVTSIAPRISEYISTFPRIALPPFSDEFDPSKRAENFGNKEHHARTNFSVNKKNKEWITEKAKEAWTLYEANDKEASDRIIRELLPFHQNLDSSEPLYLWEHMSYQMPEDLGIYPLYREAVKKILFNHCCVGKTLEAFAGFNSYVLPSLFNTVVATDYCRQTLERYPYPDRKRILLDLNKLNGKNKITVFEDCEFDTVAICCGYKYPIKITPTLKEFYRILKSEGKLVFIEDTKAGYPEAVKRDFSPKKVSTLLKRCGFKNVQYEPVPLEGYKRRGDGELYCLYAEK